MNSAYTDLLRARVAGALREAAALRAVNHNGLMGELREVIISRLLQPLLPVTVGVSSGIIISSEDQQSPQTDIVIYDKMILPPFLLAEKGLIPVEAVVGVIEVKSTLDIDELRKAQKDAKTVAGFPALPPLVVPGDPPQLPYKTSSALFAFASDLSPTGKTEITRYDEILAGESPALQLLCVVGRGFWRRVNGAWTRWPTKAEHDEVIGFLAAILNDLPFLTGRRPPPMGAYVT